MSEKLCTLRTQGGGGGAKYTETSLWTNPSPTSSSGFGAQAVTLSDSIDNYKYIAIKYAFNYQLQTGSYVSTEIAAVDDVKKWGYNSGVHHAIDALGVQNTSNDTFTRACYYISNTSIRFGSCYQTGASSNNLIAIPLEILGLNELDHGKNFDETTLWTNNAPTTARSGTNTITLSESYQNYDFVKITYNYTTTDIAPNYMSILVAPKDLYGVNGRPTIALSRTNASGNYVQVRHISSNSYTTITDTLDVSAQSTSCIIINIVGCKFK